MTRLDRYLLTMPFVIGIAICTVLLFKIAYIPDSETEPMRSKPIQYEAQQLNSARVTVNVPYHNDVTLTESGVKYCDAVPLSSGLQLHCQEMCRKYNVPYTLLLGLIECESSFDETADSGWAYGLCQIGYINEQTFYDQGLDIYNTLDNIECACIILGDYLNRYDVDLALMAYNCGEAGAEELWLEGFLSSEYSRNVRAAADKWEERLR